MGLVTGPHPQVPRTHSQWVAGPNGTPQRQAVGCGRAPRPGRPTHRQDAPPQVPSCRPHSAQSQITRAHAVELVTVRHTEKQTGPTASG